MKECLGRFFVLGPPARHGEEVMDVVSNVMARTVDMENAPFTLRNLEGPVRYDSSWVPGGRSTVLRPAAEVVELWTGEVVWDTPAVERSFSQSLSWTSIT